MTVTKREAKLIEMSVEMCLDRVRCGGGLDAADIDSLKRILVNCKEAME